MEGSKKGDKENEFKSRKCGQKTADGKRHDAGGCCRSETVCKTALQNFLFGMMYSMENDL